LRRLPHSSRRRLSHQSADEQGRAARIRKAGRPRLSGRRAGNLPVRMSNDERASAPTATRIERAGGLAVDAAAREDRSIAPTGPRGHESATAHSSGR